MQWRGWIRECHSTTQTSHGGGFHTIKNQIHFTLTYLGFITLAVRWGRYAIVLQHLQRCFSEKGRVEMSGAAAGRSGAGDVLLF